MSFEAGILNQQNFEKDCKHLVFQNNLQQYSIQKY